ncbi:5'/3'-nucleotidase SurE [Brevibacillus fluminis]|uniref:5'/3'-nucleotidase SurE n=1 Tax=Brevibacillus fluminis TaxID=511487 RepID=UPI003F88A52D
MLRILVTNDDGINAQGIRVLAEALLAIPDAEIHVVAPQEEKSGVGHGITYREALAPREHAFYGLPVKAWAVNGNPADCVKAAYFLLYGEEKPDIVFSGINVGNNLGRDIYYSGTCSAAREAVILGVPAVALSYDNFFHGEDYGQAKEIVSPILAELAEKARLRSLPADVFWNVNVPHLPLADIKGVRPASLSLNHYADVYHHQEGGYWLQREYPDQDIPDTDEDYWLMKQGYVTVTPVHIDATDRTLLADIASWPSIKGLGKGENRE